MLITHNGSSSSSLCEENNYDIITKYGTLFTRSIPNVSG